MAAPISPMSDTTDALLGSSSPTAREPVSPNSSRRASPRAWSCLGRAVPIRPIVAMASSRPAASVTTPTPSFSAAAGRRASISLTAVPPRLPVRPPLATVPTMAITSWGETPRWEAVAATIFSASPSWGRSLIWYFVTVP